MIILTIRTDKPEAELGLFDDNEQIDYLTWQAHRELGQTIHSQIKALLDEHDKPIEDLQAIVAFQGPGSFTGLRIGITVANGFAYANQLPIVAAMCDDWIRLGIGRLLKGESDKLALPEYGAEANITQPRK